MLPTFTLALVALASATRAQQIGTFTTEQHPELNWSSCTKAGCSAVKGSAVLDSEFRWIHNASRLSGYARGSANVKSVQPFRSMVQTTATSVKASTRRFAQTATRKSGELVPSFGLALTTVTLLEAVPRTAPSRASTTLRPMALPRLAATSPSSMSQGRTLALVSTSSTPQTPSTSSSSSRTRNSPLTLMVSDP
jgi:hypothetical protein